MNVSKRVAQVLVDTNIFLRTLIKEDARIFKDCQAFFNGVQEKIIVAYIPTVVVAEVSFVLSSHYKLKKQNIINAIEGIVNSSCLEIIDDLRLPYAVELYKTHNVKLIDCMLASSSRLENSNVAVLSYDRDFDKLGVRRVEPKDIIPM
jgi:predicted nucleic-acid-binding protein